MCFHVSCSVARTLFYLIAEKNKTYLRQKNTKLLC